MPHRRPSEQDFYTDMSGLGQPAVNPGMLIGAGVAAGILWLAFRARAQDAAEVLELSVTLEGNPPATSDQKALATMLRERLPEACPGAPTLNKVIKRTPVKTDTGIRIVYTFDANFAGDFDPENPFLRPAVAECMLAFIKANAAFGSRVVGIRAQRIS
jgi:hypothetical protein